MENERSRILKKALALILPTLASVAIMTTTRAETFSFDRDAPGALPAGWRSGVTGRGSPKWSVEADTSAPSRPNVLKQSGGEIGRASCREGSEWWVVYVV